MLNKEEELQKEIINFQEPFAIIKIKELENYRSYYEKRDRRDLFENNPKCGILRVELRAFVKCKREISNILDKENDIWLKEKWTPEQLLAMQNVVERIKSKLELI